MPNIPIAPLKAPLKPVTPSKMLTAPIKSITQTIKPITQAQAKPPLTPKIRYTGIKTTAGGFKVSHTSEVIDNSKDPNQYLPFVASCITCGWQARVSDKESAESLAKGHVGI